MLALELVISDEILPPGLSQQTLLEAEPPPKHIRKTVQKYDDDSKLDRYR